ncbi:LysR family transcriptional regulator [Bradyrhizobium sp. WSM 1704]|uniref:LysR substrate-binding domain-containing protein n=1 Tax=Bradyrhizobium semiaridum TaxID=2821404 RepID=UPI001CE28CF3|nr:LysR substrate-binding domain-containing protein [Bradyrhizobium semiaridum]MCA6122908.1 LysR family transcriptional regulator [Bradyrhizobium semiaridum]
MRKLPPLTGLRAFEAAARHLSFKAAAAELRVSPTAISHQVSLLERHCGQSLFRRQPRPLALTAAGQTLFPVVRDALDACAETLERMRTGTAGKRLRVTATNAFTARWLLPRLAKWRQAHPRLRLEIVGTDAVLDLAGGEADIAIRYARKPPAEGAIELFRDQFHAVASPALIGALRRPLSPVQLTAFPLIEAEWPASDRAAPRWERWIQAACRRGNGTATPAAVPGLTFREELHAIEAAIAGQGIAICSDILVAPELADGRLVAVSRTTLPGYGFYIVHRPDHPKRDAIKAFTEWARAMAR